MSADPLIAFSAGRISKEQAIEALRLRDYASLLIMLGAAGLPLPQLPPEEIDRQAAAFERLLRDE